MNRTRIAIFIGAVAIAVPAVAYAASPGEGNDRRERPQFPMEGAAFLEQVSERLDKMEDRLEARLDESDKTEADKEAARVKYEQRASKILNAAQQAASDGTVTKEEAKAMRKAAGKRHRGKRGKGKRGKKLERANFPMAGDAFVAHVDERIATRRDKLQSKLDKSQLDDEKKAEIISRANERAAKLKAAAAEAAADGTVTKDEAKVIHKGAHKGRKGAKGHKGRKGKGRKGGRKGS
jgi:tellurite resistance protein